MATCEFPAQNTLSDAFYHVHPPSIVHGCGSFSRPSNGYRNVNGNLYGNCNRVGRIHGSSTCCRRSGKPHRSQRTRAFWAWQRHEWHGAPGTLRRTLPACSGSTSRSATSSGGSWGCGGEPRDERTPGGTGTRRCSCCPTGSARRRAVFPELRGRSCSRCRSPARRRSGLSLTAGPRQGRRSLRITRCAITLCRRFYRRLYRRRRPCHTRRQACIRQSLAADPKR